MYLYGIVLCMYRVSSCTTNQNEVMWRRISVKTITTPRHRRMLPQDLILLEQWLAEGINCSCLDIFKLCYCICSCIADHDDDDVGIWKTDDSTGG